MKQKEHQLQAKCVDAFRKKLASQGRIQEIHRLFGYFAETENAIQGAVMLSLGLAKGESDLFYIDDDKRIWGIEMKEPDSSHDVIHLKQQATWLKNIPYRGYFCDSIEMFWNIINGGVGIHPDIIMENLKDVKTKTISWKKARYTK